MKSLFLRTFLLFTLAFCILSFIWWNFSPTRLEPIRYEVKEGYTLARIAQDLYKDNVIGFPKTFKLIGKFIGYEALLKKGLYVFPPGVTAPEVLNMLVKGSPPIVRVTFPEGLNIYQISEQLAIYFPNISANAWIYAMRNTELLEDLGVELGVNPPSLEGFLFPQTYHFNVNSSKYDVLKMMVYEFKKHFTQEIIEKGRSHNLSPYEVVVLASIIEEESLRTSEQPHIASVFLNRLVKKMRLQADPTVIYGAWESYNGRITRAHLRRKTPYNTYVIYGLPIGPISNPGESALKAAVNPAETDFLYFVAKGNGKHHFSNNLKEHNWAVRKYILGNSISDPSSHE